MLTNHEIIEILDNHHIEHTTVGNVIMAWEVGTAPDPTGARPYVDASGWVTAPSNMADMREWLGY